MLKLNTAVGQDLSASLVLSLVDLLAVHRPTLDRLIIVAAVQPPKRHQVHADLSWSELSGMFSLVSLSI